MSKQPKYKQDRPVDDTILDVEGQGQAEEMRVKLQFIKEKCIEANPDIVDSIKITTNGKTKKVKSQQTGTSKKLGLADVLMAIEKDSIEVGISLTCYEKEYLLSIQEFKKGKFGNPTYWNLKETLDNQSKETIDFVYNILNN